MAKVNPLVSQEAYRARNDDGTETTATWKAAQSTTWTQLSTETFRIRFRLEEEAGAAAKSATWDLQATRDGGTTWENVGTAKAGCVYAVTSPNVADGTLTTQQTTGGTGTFQAGEVSADGITAAVTLNAGNVTEVEYVCRLGPTAVNNDLIDLRIRYGDATLLERYTVIPRLTASVPPPRAVAAGRWTIPARTPSQRSNHKVVVKRARAVEDEGTLTYTLFEGVTERAKFSWNLTKTAADFSGSLSQAQMDAIVDYSKLEFTLAASNKSGPLTVEVAEAEFIAPTGSGFSGKGAGTASVTASGAGARVVRGAGAGTAAVSGAGAGRRVGRGAGAATASVTGAGAGTAVVVTGSGAGTASVTGGGTGVPVLRGTGAGTASVSASGAGVLVGRGSGSATAAVGGSGVGSVVAGGQGSATAAVTGSGSGGPLVVAGGTGSATAAVTGQGSGVRVAQGQGAAKTFVDGVGTGGAVGVTNGSGTATAAITASGAGRPIILGYGSATATVAGAGQGQPVSPTRGTGAATLVVTAASLGQIVRLGTGAAQTTVTGTGAGEIVKPFQAWMTWTPGLRVLPLATAGLVEEMV